MNALPFLRALFLTLYPVTRARTCPTRVSGCADFCCLGPLEHWKNGYCCKQQHCCPFLCLLLVCLLLRVWSAWWCSPRAIAVRPSIYIRELHSLQCWNKLPHAMSSRFSAVVCPVSCWLDRLSFFLPSCPGEPGKRLILPEQPSSNSADPRLGILLCCLVTLRERHRDGPSLSLPRLGVFDVFCSVYTQIKACGSSTSVPRDRSTI